MIIILNGTRTELNDGSTVSDLLKTKNMSRALIKINNNTIRISQFKTTQINDGDDVVLRKIAGGG